MRTLADAVLAGLALASAALLQENVLHLHTALTEPNVELKWKVLVQKDAHEALATAGGMWAARCAAYPSAARTLLAGETIFALHVLIARSTRAWIHGLNCTYKQNRAWARRRAGPFSRPRPSRGGPGVAARAHHSRCE